MEAESKVGEFIKACRSFLPDGAMSEVDHYYSHGEAELAFEGLLIEIMQADIVPENYNFDEWCSLARELGIDSDSVFDDKLYIKFQQWGNGKEN